MVTPERPPAAGPAPAKTGVGAGDIVLVLLALLLCGGVAGFFLLMPQEAAPTAGSMAPPPPVVVEEPDLAEPAPPAAAPSIIIALPGDPILVKAATRAAPREVSLSLPAHLGPGAATEVLTASVVAARLLPEDGGFLGKFPAAAGAEAELPEDLPPSAAFGYGADADVATVSYADFDEVALAPAYAWGGIGEREAEALVRAEGVRRGWLGGACGGGACGVLAPFARGESRLTISPGGTATAAGIELILTADRAQKLGELLAAGTFAADSAAAVEQGFAAAFGIDSVFPGSVVIARGRPAGGGRYQPMQVSVYDRREYVGSLAWADAGGYGVGEEPWRDLDLESAPKSSFAPGGFDLSDGIYSAAVRAGMPEPLIREAILALGTRTDLKAPLGGGGTVRILYAAGEGGSGGRILYAGLGQPGGDLDCYLLRPDAASPRRCLAKSGDLGGGFTAAPPPTAPQPGAPDAGIFVPVSGSVRLTSRFGPRMHPLLGYARLHKGVDWAAPTGRPILAAIDGSVIFAGVASGYGNHVRIRHQGGVMTTYSHLDRIEPGIAPGTAVVQGQTIGYLGTTGLSTGPHLHFEYYLSGVPVDPLTHLKGGGGGGGGGAPVKLDELQVAAFERARQAVDVVVKAEPAVTAKGIP
ncbi:M23 family metallopeptidase [Methylobrevis albus]|uniref:M23 family metallopeptidase n=1 Tax=Methylobrevis albus TaxID=2793297 RepID=A0A931I1D6_9HYPH|nr:M23 family metallopeptidase [Methylobrevis albus]MBH0237515.1 M23 family metallopeptidase [Methylobrevis albus]